MKSNSLLFLFTIFCSNLLFAQTDVDMLYYNPLLAPQTPTKPDNIARIISIATVDKNLNTIQSTLMRNLKLHSTDKSLVAEIDTDLPKAIFKIVVLKDRLEEILKLLEDEEGKICETENTMNFIDADLTTMSEVTNAWTTLPNDTSSSSFLRLITNINETSPAVYNSINDCDDINIK